MRKFLRAGGVLAGAVALTATAGAFTTTPALSRAATTAGSSPIQLSSVQPGGVLHPAPGSSRPAVPGFTTNSPIQSQSNNWAGYTSGGGTSTFRYVSADFYVPTIDCSGTSASNPPVIASQWVGLDGFFSSSTTVEQTGIIEGCFPNSSNVMVPQYGAWWETYPQSPAYPTSVTPRPGDHMNASVYYDKTRNQFRMTLTDITTGQSFTRWRSCPSGSSCRRNSAEVIAEAPFTGTYTLPLADFQTATFAQIAVTNTSGYHGAIQSSRWSSYRIAQVSDGTNTDAGGSKIPVGTPLDTPTGLMAGSTLFNDVYQPGT